MKWLTLEGLPVEQQTASSAGEYQMSKQRSVRQQLAVLKYTKLCTQWHTGAPYLLLSTTPGNACSLFKTVRWGRKRSLPAIFFIGAKHFCV